jgi:hypothetical protein
MYGLKEAGNNWFDTLKESLLARGFTQSSIDPCLFIRANCITVVYVDNCLFFAKSDDVLDSLIASLKSEFDLTSDGDVGTFLGVDIQHTTKGLLVLVQTGLIDKLISICGLKSESNQHKMSVTNILHDDATGAVCEHTCNYRSVIGMLTY